MQHALYSYVSNVFYITFEWIESLYTSQWNIKPLYHLIFLQLGQIVDAKIVLKMAWDLLELKH